MIGKDYAATKLNGHFAVLLFYLLNVAFCIWGTHWRHLANRTQPSTCGSDVALCQITSTICFICCVW